jgi:hypothetical protein
MYKHTNNKNKNTWPTDEVKAVLTLDMTCFWTSDFNTKLSGSIEKAITKNNTVVNKPELDLTTEQTGLSGARTFFT